MGDSKHANILKVRDDRDYIKLFWQEAGHAIGFDMLRRKLSDTVRKVL